MSKTKNNSEVKETTNSNLSYNSNGAIKSSLSGEGLGMSIDIDDNGWEEILYLLNEHRLICPFYENVVRLGLDVPTNILSEMKKYYKEVGKKNTFLELACFKIVNLLKQNNIAVIVVKGPAILEDAYSNIASREFGDLDLFVSVKELIKIKEIFENEGMTTNLPEQVYSHSGCYNGHHLDPIIGPYGVKIELHFSLLLENLDEPQAESSFSKFYDNSRCIKIMNEDINVLSVYDTIIHLATHVASQHFFVRGISKLLDILKFWQKYVHEIDFDELIRLSREDKAERSVLISFKLLEDIFDISLPLNAKKIIEEANIPDDVYYRAFSKLLEINVNQNELEIVYRGSKLSFLQKIKWVIEKGKENIFFKQPEISYEKKKSSLPYYQVKKNRINEYLKKLGIVFSFLSNNTYFDKKTHKQEASMRDWFSEK